MYGYGTLTINSKDVATWNMYKNNQVQKPGTILLESVLICNTATMGSSVCPFTSIPNPTMTPYYYSVTQVK